MLLVPTYASKYPPAQALVLAAGQAVLGHPAWGIWFGCALFAASLCWMLQAWVTARWAVVVVILAIATGGISWYLGAIGTGVE